MVPGLQMEAGPRPYKPDIVANKAIPPHLTNLKRKYIINSKDLHFFYLKWHNRTGDNSMQDKVSRC